VKKTETRIQFLDQPEPRADCSLHRTPMMSLGESSRPCFARTIEISSSATPTTGKPLDRSKLVRRVKQALDRAGVHRITFHELRHTFGTRMAAAGTPMQHPSALDGPRGLEDDADLRALPAERPGGRRRRSRIRVTLGSARPVRAIVARGTARSSPGMSR
jgi:hypothetical protein